MPTGASAHRRQTRSASPTRPRSTPTRTRTITRSPSRRRRAARPRRRTFTLDRINFNEAPVSQHHVDSGTVNVENAGAGIFVWRRRHRPRERSADLQPDRQRGRRVRDRCERPELASPTVGKLNYEAKKTIGIKVKVDDRREIRRDGPPSRSRFVAVTPPGGGTNGPTGLTCPGDREGAGVDRHRRRHAVGAIPARPCSPTRSSFRNDAGGRFAILGDKLFVNNGVALDFEQASAHQITVVGTDQDGLSKTQNLHRQRCECQPGEDLRHGLRRHGLRRYRQGRPLRRRRQRSPEGLQERGHAHRRRRQRQALRRPRHGQAFGRQGQGRLLLRHISETKFGDLVPLTPTVQHRPIECLCIPLNPSYEEGRKRDAP